MRMFAARVALIALMAVGCSTSWQRIPMSSIKNNDAELLFVVTDTKAYVLVGSRFEADVVHGVPDREWDRDPSTPVELRPNDSPEELAKRSHWTQVVPFAGDVKVPFREIRYSSAGDPPSGGAAQDAVWLIRGGAVAIVVLAVGVLYVFTIVAN